MFETTSRFGVVKYKISPRLTIVERGKYMKAEFIYKLGDEQWSREWNWSRISEWDGAEAFYFDAEFSYLLPLNGTTVEDVQKIFDYLCSKEADETRKRRSDAELTFYWHELARKAANDAEAAAQRAEKSAFRMFIAAALAVAASLCAVLSHWTHFQP